MIKCTYEGKEYKSLSHLARVVGINRDTLLRNFRKVGHDESRLEYIIAKLTRYVVDHKGNHYKSLSEMCRVYNILLETFLARFEDGFSLEYCLTKPVRKYKIRKKESKNAS